jgi:hypothetical protein
VVVAVVAVLGLWAVAVAGGGGVFFWGKDKADGGSLPAD